MLDSLSVVLQAPESYISLPYFENLLKSLSRKIRVSGETYTVEVLTNQCLRKWVLGRQAAVFANRWLNPYVYLSYSILVLFSGELLGILGRWSTDF